MSYLHVNFAKSHYLKVIIARGRYLQKIGTLGGGVVGGVGRRYKFKN